MTSIALPLSLGWLSSNSRGLSLNKIAKAMEWGALGDIGRVSLNKMYGCLVYEIWKWKWKIRVDRKMKDKNKG
jgi:hypothetical protein